MFKYRASVVCGLGLLLLAACSGSDGRQGVEGMVSLDGQPLNSGLICFRPMSGTGGPSAGCPIEEGRFVIAADKGIFMGKFRVEITARRKTGRKVKEPMGNIVDETVEAIPTCYNRQSTLTAEVKAGGPNQFEFALKSK